MSAHTTRMRLAVLIAAVAAAVAAQVAAQVAHAQSLRDFPFDREMLLQAEPLRPGKRMPSVTIGSDGRAVIDLWCRSLPARIQLGEGTVTIMTGVAPEELSQLPIPSMLSAGQCTDPRIAADSMMLASLLQASRWEQRGDIVTFSGGPAALRFRPAGN